VSSDSCARKKYSDGGDNGGGGGGGGGGGSGGGDNYAPRDAWVASPRMPSTRKWWCRRPLYTAQRLLYLIFATIALLFVLAVHIELGSLTRVPVHEVTAAPHGSVNGERDDGRTSLEELHQLLAAMPRPAAEGRKPPLGLECATKLVGMLRNKGQGTHCQYAPGPVHGQCCCRMRATSDLLCLPTAVIIGTIFSFLF